MNLMFYNIGGITIMKKYITDEKNGLDYTLVTVFIF